MATMTNRLKRLGILAALATFSSGFVVQRQYSIHQQSPTQPSRTERCASSNKDDNDDDSVDSFRLLLESSWNVETMGQVPTSAASAADAAATALLAAQTDNKNEQSIFLVDILLPQYDIAQGSNLYDEVLAVEFCVELTERLEGKSVIVMKDSKAVDTVDRIFRAREAASSSVVDDDDDDDDDDEEEEEGDDDDDDDEEEEEEEDLEADDAVMFYDDFEDFGAIGDSDIDNAPDTPSSVDDLRRALESTWEQPAAEPETGKSSETAPSPASSKPSTTAPVSTKRYRLASMLGDAVISKGSDMVDDVVEAVTKHAQPNEEEDTIIILSAASQEEMIGVRGLTQKYQTQKTIILVNCKFSPLPRELYKAQTVYSILPLIARSKVSEGNLFGPKDSQDNSSPAPKVVVLRSFPRDWEVHVDMDGKGFQLAATAPASQVEKRGPSMEWIASAVKRYLQAKSA